VISNQAVRGSQAVAVPLKLLRCNPNARSQKYKFLFIYLFTIVDALRQPVKLTAIFTAQVFLTHASQCLYLDNYALPLSKKAAKI
jgi:hypothetical protein